jgi:hypothetical protein
MLRDSRMIMSDGWEAASRPVSSRKNFNDNPAADCLLTLVVDSLFSNMYVTIRLRYHITLAIIFQASAKNRLDEAMNLSKT